MSFPSAMKLNTVELEQGLNPNGKIEELCSDILDGAVFDNDLDNFFTEENIKNAFGDNYKFTNDVVVKSPDGTEKTVKIPGFINGGMGTNVSSAQLVEAMNKIGFGGHLSTIGLGFYYYEQSEKDFHKKPYKKVKEIVNNDFEEIFINELGLSEEFINKHFFECNDLLKEDEEVKKNTGFNAVSGRANIMRKMDLVALYRKVNSLKENGNTVGVNAMYKTGSYIAMLKLASIIGIDYITTAAGNPDVNPKEFLKEFYSDAEKEGLKIDTPAFGLLISTSRVLNDFDYDYYIFEEGKTAGGHVIRLGKTDKFNDFQKVKDKMIANGKENTPIYAAGGIYSNITVKEALEAGYDGVQAGTTMAVSNEAVDGEGEEFKNRLISGNHLGDKSEIDKISNNAIEKVEKKINKYIGIYNVKIINFLKEKFQLDVNQENKEISQIRDYLYMTVYKKFYGEKVTLEDLSDEQIKKVNAIDSFISKKLGNDQKVINKVFRNYGNAKKFLEELEKYRENNDGNNPTHVVFDSTVGFPGRSRITDKINRVFAGKLDSKACISCLTECILAGRGGVNDSKGSTFCIYDWLDQIDDNKENIAFSGLSTVPYSEIRPVKDIMAYFMGTYVNR